MVIDAKEIATSVNAANRIRLCDLSRSFRCWSLLGGTIVWDCSSAVSSRGTAERDITV